MNHYILRNVLTIFGIPVVAYIILQLFNWYGNMVVEHDLAPLSTERVQFPLHNPWAIGGINRFNALTQVEQNDMLEFLDRSITDVDSWLAQVSKEEFTLICLGENHEGQLRNLIAERILPRLPTDIFMLEGKKTDAARILRHMWTSDYVPLLDKNYASIVRAIKTTNPDARILGIEETLRQFDTRRGGDGNSRESSIEQNLRAGYQPGKQHMVLYGAFHCSHQSKWLFSRLNGRPPGNSQDTMLNVRIAREHIDAPVETFTYFLDELGLPRGDYVITDTAAVAKRFRQWFPFLAANDLEHYSALVVLRPSLYPANEDDALQP